MIMNYKQIKTDVMKLYASFLPLAHEVKGDAASTFDTTLNQLTKDAENINRDIFRLMIVGEAKSGKSTFINAYLGKDILPMDVKQCTSSIVVIRYGEKYTLTATYADKHTEHIEEDAAIKAFLVANAALDDAYRDIPVNTINLQLIVPKKGRATEPHIKELLKVIEKENIYKLDAAEYERRVREYITEKCPHWKDIVCKMEIEYPFDDEDLRSIQIVDSPGVNAEGRVGEITDEHIIEANAVMFLKPLVGTTLETTSFKKFLETVSADRSSSAMFLVLTRAANENRDNVLRIQEDAYRQFPNINQQQIICLDSKVEMFRNKVKSMGEEELRTFMDEQIQANKLDSFLEVPWSRSQYNRDTYLENLSALSNFNEMDRALNQFARKAQYILLSQLLDSMTTVLKKIKAEQEENVAHYKTKAKNPKELECQLENTKTELGKLQEKINFTLTKVSSKYMNIDGIIVSRANEEMDSYRKEIEKIAPTSRNIDELEKITFRKINLLREVEAEIQKNIVAECDEALIAFSEKGELNYTSLTPDLTPDIINSIKSERESQATDYIEGGCFKKAHTELDQSRYFGLVKGDIQSKLTEIKNALVKALQTYVNNVKSAYKNELKDNISLQEERYRQIAEDKATAEEMQAKIEAMEATINQVTPMMSEIEKLKGGIDKYV